MTHVDELLDALDGQLAVLDRRGFLAKTNQAWGELSLPGAQVGRYYPQGSNYLEAVSPALAAELRAVLEARRPYSTEYACADERWFRLTARPIADGALLHHVDITASKSALAAMRASESRLAAIVEHTPNVAIQVYDRQGRVLRWNRQSERMYGWTEAEAVGRALDELILTPQENAVFLAAMEAVERTGAPVPPYTWEYRAKDGRTGVGYSTVFAVPQREPGEFICMDVDITELHRGQASHARLVALLEATTDYVAITDLESRPLYLNRALRAALGMGEGEALDALPLEKVYPPDTAQFLRTVAFPTAIREGSWSGEALFIGADGVPKPTSQVVLCHRDAKGRVEFVSTTARDLTAQKALEAQLLQSQKMESIGRLAGGIAHDFNNVLTAIVGAAELARVSLPRSHVARDALDLLIQATDRAHALTRQLLTFARKQAAQPKVLPVHRLVQDAERLLRRLIGEDIELATLVPADLPPIRVDPGHFEQLLINLVVNARDAMPRGGRVVIAAEHADDWVRLTISDTGTGMTDEVQRHVFEPFFTTKDPGRGTGLGLATCYGIAKQAGGDIRVESALGVGTTFYVDFPAQHAAPEQRPTDPRATPAARGGHETILLVEDEAIVRELAERVLREAGYRVLAAARGEDALQLARRTKDPIDLVLTDVIMPGLDGRELAQALRRERPELAVLYMSGYTEERTEAHGVRPEGREFIPGLPPRDPTAEPGWARCEFIAKPFTPNALAGRVRELLDRRGR